MVWPNVALVGFETGTGKYTWFNALMNSALSSRRMPLPSPRLLMSDRSVLWIGSLRTSSNRSGSVRRWSTGVALSAAPLRMDVNASVLNHSAVVRSPDGSAISPPL